MTYIVNENCIACKYTDCVEVCPVDCFYEGENMLVIHPDECIDCGVCEPECPVDAIKPDTEPDMEKWVEFNRKYLRDVAGTRHAPGSAARGGRARRRDRQDGEVLLRGRRRGRLTRKSRFGVRTRHFALARALKRLRHIPLQGHQYGLTSHQAYFLV